MINREAYTAWGQLLHTVRTSRPPSITCSGHPVRMAGQPSRAGSAVPAGDGVARQGGNAEISRAYDFSACGLVVDVGGGHGQLLSAIVTANPHLSGVLLDLSAGIEAARRGVGGPLPRCELVVGDFFASVPAADTYVIKKVVHDWSDEQAVRILANCRRSMHVAGRVLVVETIVPPGNEADPIKLMDLNMLAVTGGMERTREQYERLFAIADLRLADVLPTGAAMSILEGVAA